MNAYLWSNRAFFDQSGALSHFQAVGVDITERRRAEQAEQQLREQLQERQRELEAIFEAARSVSIVKTDLESVILEASTGAEELFGYAREELIGSHASQLVTDPEVDHAHVTRLVREREPLRRETELIRRDGSTFPAQLTIHPVTDHRGDVVAAVGVSLDMSDQKRAERELKEAVEAKTTFLNAVSHDLRTPLNALMGFLELLDEPGLPEQQHAEYIKYCRQGAQRLLGLIDSLLDLSRLQAGRLAVTPAPFNLHALIDCQHAEFRHLAAERGLELGCRVDPHLPQWVEGDATRLAQTLSNLLSNAVKYTDEGRVDLEVVPQEGERVTFRVRDTGPGIPQPAQEQIFSAFDRGYYAGAQRGHGLGLAIVRELLSLLGGELNLDSAPGLGTTFSVTVPLPAVAAPAASSRAGDGDPGGVESSQAIDVPEHSLRVLVADDEPANVMLARIMLEQLGCSVTTAENAADALASWGEGAFDLLVLDRALPDLYGEQVAERIRAQEQTKGSPGVPIALYTAYGRTEVSDLLGGALFDAYLGKPLDRSELKRLVEYVAHHTRLSRL
ncbi:MAG: PAS domain S-box protein [Halorhodospira halophila]|uniref:hybrid sensor histidine kinase/response regulator n=1 Tax=Halorhodospira halophila TaxID=1053 RepID=UPI0026F04357|nr:ATP-binding protein [Halorhodospira halophila]MCC3750858.1 PAS domain S-box protein [Halorhodospira halophila]